MGSLPRSLAETAACRSVLAAIVLRPTVVALVLRLRVGPELSGGDPLRCCLREVVAPELLSYLTASSIIGA